ncbi:GntR family transcriptional regulator [Paraglaciecola sp. 2405UD69-4]|uniref:GntR family transcriptional regulator n=1 Tax=Paraglaciecola sp. 2405UD69-4 TaxID=3391836 RepID=UPI0039C9CDFD
MSVITDSQTSVGKVVTTLKRAIFTGELQPGEQLREVLLTEHLSVSRNSVREALRVLSANGLTSHMPNKGVRVRKLSISEVEEIFKTRLIIERQAVLNANFCEASLLQQLAAAMNDYAKMAKTNDPVTVAEAHNQFHAALVGITGSKHLMELEHSLMQELQVVIASVDSDRNDLTNEIKKHQALTNMLLEKRIDEAVEWIENDLALTKDFVIQHLCAPKQKFKIHT